MEANHLLAAAIFSVASIIPAQAGDKDDLAKAIKMLAEKDSYSWTSTTQRSERPGGAGDNNRSRSIQTEGKTAEGIVYMKSSRGDRSFEWVSKGDKAATKRDEGWAVVEPRANNDDAGRNDGQRRRGGRGAFFRDVKTPSVLAEELLANVSELKKDGDAYTGELNEEGARSLVSMWGGGRNRGGDAAERPQPTGVVASAKFWVEDGVLTKYETVVAGKISFNGNERDLGRTTTVEITEVGSTKIDVPDDIMSKLSAEEKPATQAEETAAEQKQTADGSKAADE